MDSNEANAITIKDSNLQLYLPSSSSSSSSSSSQHRSLPSIMKIPIWKDVRLEHLDIKRLNRIITDQWFYSRKNIRIWVITYCRNIRNRRLRCTNNI